MSRYEAIWQKKALGLQFFTNPKNFCTGIPAGTSVTGIPTGTSDYFQKLSLMKASIVIIL